MLQKYRQRLAKYVPILLVALLFTYSVICVLYLFTTINNFSNKGVWRADFLAFYTAGDMLRDRLSKSLYDLDLQTSQQQMILAGRSMGYDLLAFNYPPPVAILFYPLSYLPLETAYIYWVIAHLVILGIGIWLLFKTFPLSNQSLLKKLGLIIGWLTISPMLNALLLGNITFVVFLAIIGLYYGLRNDKPFLTAFFLIMGMTKPTAILFPLIILIYMGRWKVLWSALILALVIFAVLLPVFGVQTWFDYIPTVTGTFTKQTTAGVYPEVMPNVRGLLTILTGDNPDIDLISLVSFVGSFLFVNWLAWRYRNHKDCTLFLISIAIVMSTLFGLHVNLHDGLFLVLPVIYLYNALTSETTGSSRISQTVLLVLPLLYQVYNLTLLPVIEIQFLIPVMIWMLYVYGKTLYTKFPLKQLQNADR